MVGPTVNISGYVSMFQYVSCSLPVTTHEFSSPAFIPGVPTDPSLSIYRAQREDGLVDESTSEPKWGDDGNIAEDLGDESIDDSEFIAGSEALDTSLYPPGFGPCIHRPNITPSLEEYDEPLISQVEDTPVHTTSSTAATNTELSAPLTDVPTNMAVSQVDTDGYTIVVFKRTCQHITEKHKQQEIQKAIAASVLKAPRTRKNQACGSK